MTTRREMLAGLGAMGLASAASAAQPLSAPGGGVASAIADTAPVGRYGFILVDFDSGKVVEEANADALMIPASLSKIPTAFVTLSEHGPGGRFQTRLAVDGEIEDGVLRGDLHLIGGGDPSLETADLIALVDRLRTAGLRQVTGRFIYFDAALPRSLFLDKTQPWQAAYNPGLGGLNLNHNRVRLSWADSGGLLTARIAAVSDGEVVRCPSVGLAIAQGGPEIAETIEENVETWTLSPRLLRGKGRRWLPVRLPGAFTAGVFREVAAARGIALPEPQAATEKQDGRDIAAHTSESIHQLLRGMMRYSNNLTAEALGASSGYAAGGRPRSIRAAGGLTAKRIVQEVGGIGGSGWNGFSLENHSGLSVLSRATPRQIAYILRTGKQRWGDLFTGLFNDRTMTARYMDLIPGTAPPEHQVRGKTGSMHFVRGLAGYVSVGGRDMIYAIMANEDASRARLNAEFSPYREISPGAAANWGRRSRDFEKALLKDWVLRFGA